MNRRSFLSALAAIPGLSWIVKNDLGIVADAVPVPVSLNNRFATDAPVAKGAIRGFDAFFAELDRMIVEYRSPPSPDQE